MFEVMLGGGKSGPDLSKFTLKGVTTPITTVGINPPAREHAAFIVHENMLYMYGGYNAALKTYCTDMWKLDLNTYQWQNLNVTIPNGGFLSSVRAFVVNNLIYLVSNIPRPQNAVYYAYNIATNVLSSIQAVATNPTDIGNVPGTVLIGNVLYMVGGNNHYFQGVVNIHKLDVVTNELTRLSPGGTSRYQQTNINSYLKEGKIYTQLQPMSDRTMAVYDINTDAWTRYTMSPGDVWPESNIATKLDNGEMYHFLNYRDLHYFDLTSFKSTEIKVKLFSNDVVYYLANWENKLIAMINGDPSKLHVIT